MRSYPALCDTKNLTGFHTKLIATPLRVLGSSACVRSASYQSRNRPKSTDTNDSIRFNLRAGSLPRDARQNQTSRFNYPPRFFKSSTGQNTPTGPLRGVHVAIRVKELCRTGQLEEAIEYCSNAATAVQDPVAWNTIIQTALDARRYNFAYTQFLAMKKRAIKPTVATFHMFLAAYAQTDPALLTPLQLERAQKLYTDWRDLVSSERGTPSRGIHHSHPAAVYIDVLANIAAYQKIWDIFYELESQGPLAPNEHVFTSMFLALSRRIATSASSTDDQSIGDAKLVWRQVICAVERQPFRIDSYLVTAALRALQHGGKTHHELAFEIMANYLDLRPPNTTTSSESRNTVVELNARALDAALSICRLAGRPELVKYFIDDLVHRKEPSKVHAVTTSALDHLLAYYASSGNTEQAQETIDWMLREAALPSGLHVKPGHRSWAIAFRACATAKDWTAAKALIDRMTGFKLQPYHRVHSSGTWLILPDAEIVYQILNIAYTCKPVDRGLHERQLQDAFEIVEFSVGRWSKGKSVEDRLTETHPARAKRRLAFQNALSELVKKILSEFESLGMSNRWKTLGRQVERMQAELPQDLPKLDL